MMFILVFVETASMGLYSLGVSTPALAKVKILAHSGSSDCGSK